MEGDDFGYFMCLCHYIGQYQPDSNITAEKSRAVLSEWKTPEIEGTSLIAT